MLEIWTDGAGIPGRAARRAEQAERAGFDGMTVVDSQNLSGDPYVALALAAKATARLKLATGVTNPYTRHAAVTASSIATVQAESGGRAVLGIGRGDSALAHLGRAPVKPAAFADYLQRLQGYLRGEDVPFEAGADVDRLGLANRPAASRIAWIRPGKYPKVPVDVAATGPAVIRIGAVHAERLTFAVGASLERLSWAIATARQARADAGLDPLGVSLGAYVNVVPHPDASIGREMAAGGISLFTRFSALHGRVVGPAKDSDRNVFSSVHDAYDMERHSQASSPQASRIPSEFAEKFAILGPPAYCVERLREVLALGIERLVIVGGSPLVHPDAARQAEAAFVEEVMPALREAEPARG
jgi:5,10-methylenetetrahydromethanopterin reductase